MFPKTSNPQEVYTLNFGGNLHVHVFQTIYLLRTEGRILKLLASVPQIVHLYTHQYVKI